MFYERNPINLPYPLVLLVFRKGPRYTKRFTTIASKPRNCCRSKENRFNLYSTPPKFGTMNTSQTIWRCGMIYIYVFVAWRGWTKISFQLPSSLIRRQVAFRWLPSLKLRACPWKGTMLTGEACLSTIVFFPGGSDKLLGSKRRQVGVVGQHGGSLAIARWSDCWCQGGKGGESGSSTLKGELWLMDWWFTNVSL